MDFLPPQILPNLFFFNFFQPARESPADCRLFALGALFSPALFRLFSFSGAPNPRVGWFVFRRCAEGLGKHYGIRQWRRYALNERLRPRRKPGR
jgi:hypothetical protein